MKKIVTNGTNITTTDYLGASTSLSTGGFQTEVRGSRIPVRAKATQTSNNEQYLNGVLLSAQPGSFAKIFLKDFLTLRPPHAEGYVKNTVVSGQNTYDYVYNYTDLLDERNQSTTLIEVCERSSIRVSYAIDPQTGELDILEETEERGSRTPKKRRSHKTNNREQNHTATLVSFDLEILNFQSLTRPFGLKHRPYAGKQNIETFNQDTEKGIMLVDNNNDLQQMSLYKYKYNGKELQDELGLGLYDYGWRNYDPAIARWVVPDPLLNDLKTTIDFDQFDEDDDEIDMSIAFSEKMKVGGGVYNPDNLNPFSYGYNNPVSFDDPDGRCPICVVGIFLLFGGGVAMNSTGDHVGDQQKIQTAVNTQRDILIAAGTGGAGTARGTVTTVVGATAKNAGNANKAKAVQNGAQKTQQAKDIINSKKIDGPNSKYENTTNPSKNNSKPTTPNRTTDVNKKDFEKNLQKSGHEKTKVNDKVTKFEKDGKSYTTRPDKGGGTSADFRKNDQSGKVDLKIRLGGEQFKGNF